MTPDKEQRTKDAARRVEIARIRIRAMESMNSPTDYEERLKVAEQFALARAELYEAQAELEAAIKSI